MIVALGYGGMGYGMYMDPTYLLVLVGIGITMIASAKMNSTFAKYCKVASASGLTGADVAKRILQSNGIYDVTVQPISGQLTDHYDPSKKTVNLSEPIYNATSVAALGVAAHECGHAIQDNVDYVPLRIRSSIVPVVNIGTKISWPMIIIGVLLGGFGSFGGIGSLLIQLGILMFSLAVAFQIITLPVEIDASRRALIQLKQTGVMSTAEEHSARKVLSAAAMTYIAAAASYLLQLLRLVILFGGRRRND